MKRRILALVIGLAMLLTVLPGIAETATVSGTATGTAKGFGGEVTVTITLTDGKVTDVQMTGPDETEGIGSIVIKEWPAAFVAADGVVDTYSGATFAQITRNGVLEAANAALTALGVKPEDYARIAVAEEGEDQVLTTDVVIVGAGGAGMTAAITAADAGKNVVIVESQPAVGGNSVKSTGGMNAAKTAYQDENTFAEAAGVEKTLAAAEGYADNEAITALAKTVKEQWDAYQANPEGYFDSTELFALDTMIGGKGINDPELVNTLVNNSAAAIDWLKTVNIDLKNVGQFGGAAVKRIHRPVDENGKTLSVGAYTVPLLETAVKERENIILMLDTTATEILTDANGAACGILAKGKSGNTVQVNAGAVILASGGFGANLDMVVQYAPQLAGFMTTNASGIQGQGIQMATAIGAATVDMEQVQIHPTVQADTASLITEGLRGDGAILVNAEGKRFIDEVGTRDVVSAAEIAQPGSFSWLIVDQKMVDASSVIQGYIKRDLMLSGDTYEALAEILGIPAADFAATMNTWNGYVAEKNDPDFGRTSFANPLDTAPFYAVKVTAGIHHTMGGLKIDPETRVLKEDGSPIPGLFAAGEVTGGVHGGNRLGGNAVADIIVFGRIAGSSAAAYAAPAAEESAAPAAEETAAAGVFTPGTYEGSDWGYGQTVPVTVKVTVDDKAITAAEITGEEEEPFGKAYFGLYADALVGRTDGAIDAMTNATMTRNAIERAVGKALQVARGEIPAEEALVSAAVASDGAQTFVAGTYTAIETGFNGPMAVKVTFTETNIESIEVISSGETPEIGGAAMEKLIPAIIEANSSAVDAIAGATYSSTALRNAVSAAAEHAGCVNAEAFPFQALPEAANP